MKASEVHTSPSEYVASLFHWAALAGIGALIASVGSAAFDSSGTLSATLRAIGLTSAVAAIAIRAIMGRIESAEQAGQIREEELRQTSAIASERYKLLTENLAAAVIVRGQTGNIVYCSPYTEILTGYPVQDMYADNRDFFEHIVHEDDRSKYTRSLQVTRHGEPFQFRYRFWHKTGLLMWAESRTVPILDEDGTVISSLSITLDVTGNVRYQRQVEEKNEELQDFTYMVSHDLKSPIFTLKGMLGILLEELGTEPRAEVAEPLDHMSRALRRLEQLVTSVLEYSRASSFESRHERIDFAQLLPEVLEDFKPHLATCSGAVTISGTLPVVIGDSLRLTQVFSNLLSNSIKYRNPNRPLQIRIEGRVSSDPKLASLAFSDNGLGIPPDKHELIFRPFHRLHGAEIEGSGIGLACVKKLLERLGGSISVESDGRSGSTFVVSLPVASLQEKLCPTN
ncbi:MAG: PAS domain S-box protein [Proteobacteria bacterium]|nr:PAS domain S-box protein [Pseudomonadota bacterium]